MGGGRRARRCLRHGRWRRSWGVRPGRWRARTASCGGRADRLSRSRSGEGRGGRFAARALVVGGRAQAAIGGQRRPGARCAGPSGRRGDRSGARVRGAACMAWRRWRAGRRTRACCIWSMPSRGATTTPTSAVCCPASPSCWSTCGGARWAWSCRAATRWECAGSPTWPAGGWRGGRGAADRVCCWSGCWPRRAWRRRPRAASLRIPTSPWPPRWRRAPPTPDWRCARSRAPCDLDFVGVTVEPFELAVRADDVDSAAGLLARLHDPAFTDRVAALGGYDLSETGAQRRAT